MIRLETTEEVQFVLANGQVIHACLDSNPSGGTRLCLYSDDQNLVVIPLDSRAVRVTTYGALSLL